MSRKVLFNRFGVCVEAVAKEVSPVFRVFFQFLFFDFFFSNYFAFIFHFAVCFYVLVWFLFDVRMAISRL